MGITIIKAVYGTTNISADVTSIVQGIVNTGNDDISVDNDTMGGDPDFNVQKSFAVIYTNNATASNPGCYTVLTAQEGDILDLVSARSRKR